MRRLQQILQDLDSGHLRIIADLWDVEAPTEAPARAAGPLALAMLDADRVRETTDALRPQALRAVHALVEVGGAVPIADLERRFGPIRPMGPGRRDREKPWRSPASPLEDLWYRGILARAFADTPLGPQEFGFLPTDLVPLLAAAPAAPVILGAPAPAPAVPTRAGFAAVEDATTILATLRRHPGKSPLGPKLDPYLIHPESGELVLHLLGRLRCVKLRAFQPDPDAARRFLESSRGRARQALFQAWRESTTWNDLAHLESLQAPRPSWPNDPVLTREVILGFVSSVPKGTWWSVDAFVAAIRSAHPGFQRPGGDFDAWYLRDRKTGAFLRGFESWQQIEGELLRSILAGPLNWLGAIEVGQSDEAGAGSVFRVPPDGQPLQGDRTNAEGEAIGAKAAVQPDGRVTLPLEGSRAQRYQISRVTTWVGRDAAGFHFLLTPSSLRQAARQGLKHSQVVDLLEAASKGPLPPPLAQALDRWKRRGSEGAAERSLLLRVREPSVLEELRRGKTTARFLGDRLGPREARVREADWERLRAAAARMGILLDPPDAEGPP